MASIQLEPPEPLDFQQSDNCLRWKCHFNQYRVTSGLAGEAELCQVSTLLYCLGEEAGDMLASANLADARIESMIVIRESVEARYTCYT